MINLKIAKLLDLNQASIPPAAGGRGDPVNRGAFLGILGMTRVVAEWDRAIRALLAEAIRLLKTNGA